MEEKFKIKPLSKQKIIISLDRLTRFKPTEDKYLRVFKDIVTSNLIAPKFKKNQLNTMKYDDLTKIAENILNFSLAKLNIPLQNNFEINQKLLEYESSIFNSHKNVLLFLKNKINYQAAIELMDGNIAVAPYKNRDLPLNLKWLKSLGSNINQDEARQDFALKFPLKKIVIVEGITEEILLPKFAKICGCDFNKEGINLISAGGKNQVVKLFYQFADILKLPIFVLLDNDAIDNFKEIAPKMRRNDQVHVLKSGEFEDTLPLNLIKRTLNKHPRMYTSVVLNDLRENPRMTGALDEIFKQRGLEFKKAEFATMICENIIDKKDISAEIEAVISEIAKG